MNDPFILFIITTPGLLDMLLLQHTILFLLLVNKATLVWVKSIYLDPEVANKRKEGYYNIPMKYIPQFRLQEVDSLVHWLFSIALLVPSINTTALAIGISAFNREYKYP